jgi:hypothetical protein
VQRPVIINNIFVVKKKNHETNTPKNLISSVLHVSINLKHDNGPDQCVCNMDMRIAFCTPPFLLIGPVLPWQYFFPKIKFENGKRDKSWEKFSSIEVALMIN